MLIAFESIGSGIEELRAVEADSGSDRVPVLGPEVREAIERLRARQAIARRLRIDELVATAERNGQPSDRAYWSLVHDLELAPMTTNREQLGEIGITLPPAESLSDEAIRSALPVVIHGLASFQTYLLNTDHLADRELYGRLAGGILDEPVREICEGSGGREFIDMAGGAAVDGSARVAKVDRDRTLPRPDP